ncbi:MAG: CoA-binding protein [Nitrospinota bacterium]
MAPEEVAVEDIVRILREARTIAVVGLSDKPERASYRVASYLQRQGYRILPVNPKIRESLGVRAVGSLREIGEPVDLVDVFRRAECVPPVAEDALAMRPLPKVFWMQLGIRNEEAAAKLRAAGVRVVQDRCALADHRAYLA